jgi:sarcosine oxidase subunit gamma
VSDDAAIRTPPTRLSADYDGAISIQDKTHKRRSGVRGVGANSWLKQQNLVTPDTPNQIVLTDNKTWVMSLSSREYWVLEPHEDANSFPMGRDFSEDGVYPLFCQSSHRWFVIAGEAKAQMMAKLCGVDLRSENFELGAVAQTQLALVNCIIARHTMDKEDVFSVFIDQSFAEYTLEVLLDAREEFL